MHHFTFATLTTFAIVGLTACVHNDARRSEQRSAELNTPQPSLVMGDDYESQPPATTIPDVMRSKLARSQAILEGIALADFVQVEINARDLKRISERSEWLVVESPSYHGLSEEFRRVTGELVAHARAENLHAVTADYANLTNTCVACHSYLRAERPFLNVPGRVSMRR